MDRRKRENEIEAQHPIDHGFAWVILVASVFSTFYILGIEKMFGVLYAEFIREYKASATSTSLLQLVQSIVYSISSIFVSTVGLTLLTCRQGAVIGGVLLSLAFSLSSLATSIYMLLFTYSFLIGVGTAFSFTSSVVVLSLYFDKRRGMANGFMMAAGSLGGLVMVPIIRVLIDYYMLDGALLLFSGLVCHTIVAGFLFRPASFYRKRKNNIDTEHICSENVEELKTCTQKTRNGLNLKTGNVALKEDSKPMYVSEPLLNKPSPGESQRDFLVILDRSNSEKDWLGTSENNSQLRYRTFFSPFRRKLINVYLSAGHFQSLRSLDISFEKHDNKEYILKITEDETAVPKTNCWRYFNFRILKNRTFLRFMLAYGFGSISSFLPIYYISIFAQEQGINVHSSDMLVAIVGAADATGRALAGFISDKIAFKRQYMIAFGLTLTSIPYMTIACYTTYWSLILFAVMSGFFGAMLGGMYTSTLLDITGLYDFNSALCLMWLAQGIIVGISSPMIGLLRDYTGSYIPCFYFFAATALFSSLFLWAELLPWAVLKTK